jgi:ribosomal-protein-alanine N-acetyltransferase
MKRAKQPIIKGERIYLRPYKVSDAKETARIWNDKEIARWIGDINYPALTKYYVPWIKSQKKRDDAYYYAVMLKSTNSMIGSVWFHGIYESTNYQIGDLAYLIGRDYRGHGYATEAAKLMIDWGFKKLKFVKITAKVNEFDKASIKVIENLGFKLEGRLRRQALMRFPRKWCGELSYGLLKEEWKK